jgi:hypothetical protein
MITNLEALLPVEQAQDELYFDAPNFLAADALLKARPEGLSDAAFELIAWTVFAEINRGENVGSVAEKIAMVGEEPIELAACLHPFDWGGTEEMDLAIVEAMIAMPLQGGVGNGQCLSFRRTDENENPSAVNFVRRTDIALAEGVLVYLRQIIIIDFEHKDAREIRSELAAWLGERETKEAIKGGSEIVYVPERVYDFVKEQMRLFPDERSKALLPSASSYYAQRISN